MLAAAPADSHYVTAPLLWPLILGVRRLGFDADCVLERAGLTLERLQDPDARFRFAQGVALFSAALEVSGDEALGLRLAELYEPGVFKVLDYLAHSSSTLREAIERLCRYERIHQDGVRSSLAVRAGRATLKQETLFRAHVPPQLADSSLANMLVIGRKLTGHAFTPLEVRFRQAEPRDTRAHVRLFGAPIRWKADYDALVFDATLLDQRLTGADPALAEALERHARELLAKLGTGRTLTDRVRACISKLMPDGDATLERLARELDMSTRTLQRRLREEGTSHKDLLEELRVALALRYLKEATLGVEDVALMLGFSDGRAFRRAFKRWRGVSPSEQRNAAPSQQRKPR